MIIDKDGEIQHRERQVLPNCGHCREGQYTTGARITQTEASLGGLIVMVFCCSNCGAIYGIFPMGMDPNAAPKVQLAAGF